MSEERESERTRAPKSPVLLIPGFTGSRLKTRRGEDDHFGIWLNHDAIGREEESGAFEPSEWWIDQMSMREDGMTPKCSSGENGHLEGLEAISVLDPNPKFAGSSAYFQALIQSLEQDGYDRGNLRAAPYDWRCPPLGLQKRDDYFSRLRATIEEMVDASPGKTPATIIAHSLGNRITQYFLRMMMDDDAGGQEWIDRHIGRYIAVSALWLGVPKSIREAVTGADGLGLTKIANLKTVYQSYGALPWMLPVTEEQYPLLNTDSFAFVTGEALTIEEVLSRGAPTTLAFMRDYFLADRWFTNPGGLLGSAGVMPPPVAHLNVLHATGQNTEVGAYYQRASEGLELDVSAVEHDRNFIVEGGIRFETPDTRQAIDGTTNSGDSFLPYGSLRYFTLWQKDFPEFDITGKQFAGRTHYDILNSEDFLGTVLDLLHQAI